jgi:hypothetical protein
MQAATGQLIYLNDLAGALKPSGRVFQVIKNGNH